MTTQTESFAAVGFGIAILIRKGESIYYKIKGGATATLQLERSQSAGTEWEVLDTFTANTGPTYLQNEGNDHALYRWNCTARSSGTFVTTFEEEPKLVDESGSSPVNTVTAYEFGDKFARKTVLECLDLAISITDDAAVAQYGGVKVYDFPVGLLNVTGVKVKGILTAGVTGTVIDNWDGDVALGTITASTGATLVSTEANIMPSAAVSAGASDKLGVVDTHSIAAALTEAAQRVLDGTATAIDMFLNFVIDDDDTHGASTALFTGTIEINWEMLGKD